MDEAPPERHTAPGRTLPLQGVRVVEMGSWMAAPGAAMLLAGMGADVVKIEPPRGDPMRRGTRMPRTPADVPVVDASFQFDNRGKRGVAIAINKPEGAELARKLIAGADVFLNNLLPSRQAKYGLDPDTLLALNPTLVHASVSGYGAEGPDAERPGYDITAYFGRGGLTQISTEPGAFPPRPRPAQGDHATSLVLVTSILAALRLVDATGRGQVIESSLLANAAFGLATDIAPCLIDGQDPPALGRRARPHALHGAFPCSDGRFLLMFMPEPHWWPRFCAVVGKPEWIEDPRTADIRSRAAIMPELTDMLDETMRSRTLAEWTAAFDAAGLIWAPAATITEFADDPQAAAIGLFPAVDHPSLGTYRTIASPIRIRGLDIGAPGWAPELGEHTVEVLTELGLATDEIAALAETGIVAAQKRDGTHG